MTRYFVTLQLSKIIANIITTLFIFWHLWIYNCLKGTSGDNLPKIEGKRFLVMENDVKVLRDETSNRHYKRETVFGYDHDNHLCYLCDVCDNQGVCNITGLNINSRYKGNQI